MKLPSHNSIKGRLIIFLALFSIILIISSIFLFLLINHTGRGKEVTRKVLENEMAHFSRTLENNAGALSVKAIELSEDLSHQINLHLSEKNISLSNLENDTEAISSLLSSLFPILLSYGREEKASGIFFLLDTTASSEPIKKDISKAGVYLMKTHPSAISAIKPNLYCLIGPAKTARDYGIGLLGQWEMEYDIAEETFLAEALQEAKLNPEKDISRLYKWNPGIKITRNNDYGNILTIPIRGEDNTIYGLCGFELSSRLFKDLYTPKEMNFTNLLGFLTPAEEDMLLLSKALYAGEGMLTSKHFEDSRFRVDKEGFSQVVMGEEMAGLLVDVKLYPSSSLYEKENWKAGLFWESDKLYSSLRSSYNTFSLALLAIIIISLLGSVLLTFAIFQPLSKALMKVTTGDREKDRNGFEEINDLIEYLTEIEEKEKEKKEIVLPPNKEFERNLRTLTPAERRVFDLYLKGYRASEISEKLCLAPSTIKTHNRRIFSKLNVTTRKELLLYIDFMNKENLFEKEER